MAQSRLAERLHEFARALAHEFFVYDIERRAELFGEVGYVAASDFKMTFAVDFARPMQKHMRFPFVSFSGVGTSCPDLRELS